jgi:hypothetical protein
MTVAPAECDRDSRSPNLLAATLIDGSSLNKVARAIVLRANAAAMA